MLALANIPFLCTCMNNKLLKTELILLLNSNNVNIEKLEKAYNNFIDKLHSIIHNSNDLTTSYFLLNHAKIEIEFLLKKEKKTIVF